MGEAIRRHWNRLWFLAATFAAFDRCRVDFQVAMAQQATANVNGVVKDPTGAVIANAQVELTNVNTAS